jgi:hypothetical protein
MLSTFIHFPFAPPFAALLEKHSPPDTDQVTPADFVLKPSI